MTEYDPEPVSDHGRVVSSGAWIGSAVALSGLGWLDTKMPAWAGFALNWAVVLGTCYAMACWKRAWYAWVAFWGMASACLVCATLSLSGVLEPGPWSSATMVMACVVVFIWYWLIRMPRLQPAIQAVERHEIHVIHHIVHHGPQLPGWTATEITTQTAAPISARKVIAGVPVRRSLGKK